MLDVNTMTGLKNDMELRDLIAQRRASKGWSQAELATRAGAGVKQQDVLRIETGKTRMSKHTRPILRALEISDQELGEFIDRRDAEQKAANIKPLPKREDKDNLVKVYASVEGGNGSMIISNEPIEYAPKPNIIPDEDDLYGVVVEGTSMVKAYRPGDTVWLHPKYRERRDEACVFRRHDNVTGDVNATIKWLVDFNSDRWKVEQLNPPKEIELKRSDWPDCYRVLGKKNRA